MSFNPHIPIQNIYYMLSYAFQVLQEEGYKKLGMEEFDNADNLFAKILINGVTSQIKRGLVREYLSCREDLFAVKGKIELTETVKKNTLSRKKLVCNFDEFSTNSYVNKIIKTTLLALLDRDILLESKKKIRNLLLYFGNVAVLSTKDINWKIHYSRDNQTYRMLIFICYLVLNKFLQDPTKASHKVQDFSDRKMNTLYEKFILEYYRKHYPALCANASHVNWQLGPNDDSRSLPNMITDVTLNYGDNVLIIDAKYYTEATQENYGVEKLRSANLYQIFTYVKNKSYEVPSETVSGILLYAQTASMSSPLDHSFNMSGNKISIKSLDLNCNFALIEEQLDRIAQEYFPSCSKKK